MKVYEGEYCSPMEHLGFHTLLKTHTGKATKGKVQDIGEVNKVIPLPLPSSDRVRG